MKTTAVFGIVLLQVFVFSLLVISSDARSPFFPRTPENDSASRHEPDPLSLAILAPTVTPTPLAPPATVETAPSTNHAAQPDAATPVDSIDSSQVEFDPVPQEHLALNLNEADLGPDRSDDPAQADQPMLAPSLLPTSTPDAGVAETNITTAEGGLAALAVDAVVDVPPPAPAGAAAPMDQAGHACQVASPPPGFDPFYAKHCAAGQLPILASNAVSGDALEQAWSIITYMMEDIAHADEIRATMISLNFRMGIIGVHETPTHLPEHSNLYSLFPGIDWSARTRAIGATPSIPLMSVSEENLLCLEHDRWRGQNLLVHEFAHAIKNLGLDYVNPDVHDALLQAYQLAQSQGLWANTYVISDVEEYWAEGVRIYFQLQPSGGTPGGQPYPANTRAELQNYDPPLYRIIEDIFGPKGSLPGC